MPRYFFNIHDGQHYQDLTGVDLADLPAVRRMAMRACTEFMMERDELFWTGETWTLNVIDERGHAVLRLTFAVSQPDQSG